jgi:hypothetical protein
MTGLTMELDPAKHGKKKLLEIAGLEGPEEPLVFETLSQ